MDEEKDIEELEIGLNKIYQRDKVIKPEVVLKEARAKDAPLHKYFEWDDKKAAEEYRLIQAINFRKATNLNKEGNDAIFMETLAKIDPDLWEIKRVLMGNKLNMQVLKSIIENIIYVSKQTGHGQVITSIAKNKVMVEAIPRRPKQQFETAIIYKNIEEIIE
jgi:hypothetical protein